MSFKLIVFSLSIFAVVFALVYAPMYLFSYEIFGFDKRIGDAKLVKILLISSFLISCLLFPLFFFIIGNMII